MKTVRKALQVLDLFNEQQSEYGLSELTQLSGMDKATTHRALTALTDFGLLEQSPDNRKYRLGVSLLRYAKIREASFPLVDIATPIVEDLVEKTGETCHFSVGTQGGLSSLVIIECKRSNRVILTADEQPLLHCTASGISYLAYGPEYLLEDTLDEDLPIFTAKTPTKETLPKLVEETRQRGYSIGDEGYEEGVYAVGAPVFDWQGVAWAVVAAASPISRITPDVINEKAQAVLEAADKLTQAFSGRKPQ